MQLEDNQLVPRNAQDTHAFSNNNQAQSGEIASPTFSAEVLADKLALIGDEVDFGHYYSDTCQFHSNYRQFKDLNLEYNHEVDEIQLSTRPEDNALRVFQILKRIELSITLEQQASSIMTSPQTLANMTSISQGVFITDQLFIPRYMWFKMKFSLPYIKEKINFFNDIKTILEQVKVHYNKGAAKIKHLDQLSKTLNEKRRAIGK